MTPTLSTEPNAIGCETAVLGSAIVYPPAAARVLGDLDADDFTDPRHRVILTVLRTMLAENTPPGPCLVLAALWRQNDVRPPTGRTWAIVLADLVHAAALPSTTAAHRRALIEARLRREAIAYAARLHTSATAGTPDEVWHALTDSVTELRLTLARLAEHTPNATGNSAPTLIRTERAA
jgi:replicative DNA helicase